MASFITNILIPGGALYSRTKELYNELLDDKTRTTTEKVDLTFRCIALVTSFAALGFEVNEKCNSEKSSERTKQIALGVRIAAAASVIASSGSSFAVKLEKNTASITDVLQILSVVIFEGGRTALQASKTYDAFAAKCCEKAPYLFPPKLVDELEAHGIQSDEIRTQIRKFFEKRATRAVILGEIVYGALELPTKIESSGHLKSYLKSWFFSSSQPSAPEGSPAEVSDSHLKSRTTIVEGKIVHHCVREPVPPQEEVAREKLLELAARMAIQLFSYNETLKKTFSSDPSLAICLCPITQDLVREPIFVAKAKRLFEKSALLSKLSENPRGYSILIDGQSVIIYATDIEERAEDLKMLQTARESALKTLLGVYRYRASRVSVTAEILPIDLDKEATELAITISELKKMLFNEIKKSAPQFVCPLSDCPIECPIFVSTLDRLFEKQELEKHWDKTKSEYRFDYMGAQLSLSKEKVKERAEDKAELNKAYCDALKRVHVREKRVHAFASNKQTQTEE